MTFTKFKNQYKESFHIVGRISKGMEVIFIGIAIVSVLKIHSYEKGIYFSRNAYRIILRVEATGKSAKRHFCN